MECFCCIVFSCFKGEAVKVGMRNRLPDDAMLPKDDGSIVPGKEILYFSLQCQKLCNNEKRSSRFEYVRSKITAQTKCTIGIDCISIQGGIAPLQHPGRSLLIN